MTCQNATKDNGYEQYKETFVVEFTKQSAIVCLLQGNRAWLVVSHFVTNFEWFSLDWIGSGC